MRVFELKIDSEFDPILKAVNYAATGGITVPELIKRWLAHGMARDFQRDPTECGHVLNQLIRVVEK